ncbi:oxidoreductase [Marinovum sp.]|uniref:oxidoreductase n=1 Tax=Marinovum sp. TaxID=2024839 RepID=UPI002B27252C|nr:oxidoreductase [Marinovum sp.]
MLSKVLTTLFLSMACAVPVAAAGLAAPEGRVLLTVSGAIGAMNAEDAARFDRAMLEALEWREVETFTSFTEGPQVFAGPTLASLLDAVQADGGTLTVTALNDYAVTFPAEMASEHAVLLAMDHSGRPMRIREKGPIWIVFPLSEAEAASAPFDNQMVWQLAKIHVGP